MCAARVGPQSEEMAPMPKTERPAKQQGKKPKAVSPKEAKIIRDVVHSRKGLHKRLAKH